jgi:hypothetical protein
MQLSKFFIVIFACGAMLFSCKKKDAVFSDNEIAPYNEVPSILIENYVNRLFIDLIGREPTHIEMTNEVNSLKSASLSVASRTVLIDKLMLSTDAVEGDGSYNEGYFRKFHSDMKGRYLNGASENDLLEAYNLYRGIAVQDSLSGNMIAYQLTLQEANKIKAVIDSREQLRLGTISVDEMSRRMMFNLIYDNINMNTFNFINASFDDCFLRFPTENEMDLAYEPVESNIAGALFGTIIASKTEYLNVLTSSEEFKEGMIRWVYLSYLQREPSTSELFNLLDDFSNGYNTQVIQKTILISNEYAGF